MSKTMTTTLAVTIQGDEARRLAEQLWRISATCNVTDDPTVQAAGQVADAIAIRLAAALGLDYGGFDFDRTNQPLTFADAKAEHARE